MSYSTRRNHNGYANTGDSYDQNYDSDPDYNVEDDLDGNTGGYGPYSTGYARSGPGDRKLDGTRDHRKKPQGGRSNYNNNDYDNYSDDDYSDDDDDYNGGEGSYGPYSTGKARSGPGDRKLDGGYDQRHRPGGNNPHGYNGYTAGQNKNQSSSYRRGNSGNYNNNNNNNSNYSNQNQQGNYGQYSKGYARSGPGDRKLDGTRDHRKKPQGGDDDYSDNSDNDYDNYNKSSNNRSYNNRGNNQQGSYGKYSKGYARSGPGDRKLDGSRDHRKKSQGDNSSDDNNNNNNNNNSYGNQNQQGSYGPYSTGKARSGPGDKRLDGEFDQRHKPGGNNPHGYNGYTAGQNKRSQSRNYRNDNDDDYDSEDYNQNTTKRRSSNQNYNQNQNQSGGYGPNSTGKARSGPGDKKLDGSKDMRKKPNRSQNYGN